MKLNPDNHVKSKNSASKLTLSWPFGTKINDPEIPSLDTGDATPSRKSSSMSHSSTFREIRYKDYPLIP